MDLVSGLLLGGSLMILVGTFSLFWRFFGFSLGPRLSGSQNNSPSYWYGVAMVALGLGLFLVALQQDSPQAYVAPFLWVLIGVAIGSVIAAPGIMLVTADFRRFRSKGAEESLSSLPLRSVIGWMLIGIGIAGGAVMLPIAALLIFS